MRRQASGVGRQHHPGCRPHGRLGGLCHTGGIDTPFHARHTGDRQMSGMVAGIPTGRAGTPEPCVDAVLFWPARVMSGHVTGQVLEVNAWQLTS